MSRGAIYVDDSGNPGAESGSIFLPSSRKSWTAVIVPDRIADEVSSAMDIFLNGVRQEFDARELHFTDIYSGRGVWKDVSPDRRKELFDLMKMIVQQFQLPIVHQTVSAETLSEIPESLLQIQEIQPGWWKPQDVGQFGLLYLCYQVAQFLRDFLRESESDFRVPLPMFVDEGLAKSGTKIDLPAWADVIDGPHLRFCSSVEMPGIQIADFVAFVISRTQWLMAQQSLGQLPKRADLDFLALAGDFNILNLLPIPMSLQNLSKEAYEFALARNRQSKGLPPWPKRKK